MNCQRTLPLVSLIVLAACQTEEQEEEPVAILPFSSVDESGATWGYIPRSELAPGIWRQEGNARICDGYMTRFEGADYCAAKVPDDWKPFGFNGQIYYAHPLADPGGMGRE